MNHFLSFKTFVVKVNIFKWNKFIRKILIIMLIISHNYWIIGCKNVIYSSDVTFRLSTESEMKL